MKIPINQDPQHWPLSVVHERCIDMTEHCEGVQDPGEKEQDLKHFPEKAVGDWNTQQRSW